MAHRFGLTAAEQLTCGCHIHVAVVSDEEAVAVVDRVQPWLAVLLAVTANSPFWNGLDTGAAPAAKAGGRPRRARRPRTAAGTMTSGVN